MDGVSDRVLVIRADANPRIGTGHFMRSLALGQAWKDADGHVAFLTTCKREGLLQRLGQEGFKVHGMAGEHPDPHDLQETLRVLRTEGASWVSLDGYFFDQTYHEGVACAEHPLLVFDDNAHLNRYLVDVLLNQNVHAESLSYQTRPDTIMLLGTRYVMLRREFIVHRSRVRQTRDVARRVLVTLGGSDPANATSRVIAELDTADVDDLEVTIVAGPDNASLTSLQRLADRLGHTVHITANIERMAELMASADLAVSGGGTTLWELAHLGVPVLALIMAENQKKAVETLESRGVLRNLGELRGLRRGSIARALESLARDPTSRARMAAAGRRLVDGRGPRRVLKTLAALKGRV